MRLNSVRARLTLWHSGLLAALVVAFAVASYTFLQHTELSRIDSTIHEQSEIVTQTMRAAGIVVGRHDRADTLALLASLHDLRARSLRAWVFDSANHPVVSTAMVHEGEGPGEERRVLGDTLSTATLRAAAREAAAAPVRSTVPTRSGGMRLYASPLPSDVGPGTIIVTYPLRELRGLLSRARNAAIVAVALAFLISVPAGYLLARESLAPVADMSAQAERIGGENLHERLPVANAQDELGQLASTFNALLDRVANAFEQQRRFMADASHELRTPVAIMRGEAEVALGANDRTREEYRDALEIVRDASDRLTRTVNDVFLLARVDAGQVPTSPVALYFDELVTDTCRSMRSLANARRLELVLDVSEEVPYVGDETLLARLVMNLVENAIKYSYEGGTIEIVLRSRVAGVTLTVENGGPGIPADARARIFDRFYRGDVARTHVLMTHGSGSGLGLSIARWIAEVHGGSLELMVATPSTTVFAVRLPHEPVLRV